MVHEHPHSPLCCDYIYIYHQMSNFHLEASRILSWGGFTNHPTQNISSHQQPTLGRPRRKLTSVWPLFLKKNNNNKSSRPLEKFCIRGQNSMWGKLGGFFFEKKKEQSFWMRKKLLQRRYMNLLCHSWRLGLELLPRPVLSLKQALLWPVIRVYIE